MVVGSSISTSSSSVQVAIAASMARVGVVCESERRSKAAGLVADPHAWEAGVAVSGLVCEGAGGVDGEGLVKTPVWSAIDVMGRVEGGAEFWQE